MVRLLASVAVLNLVAGLGLVSAAQADPSPPDVVDRQFVTTESRAVNCVVATSSILCTGNFAKQPVGCGETQFCHQDDSERPYHTVSVEAEAEGLQWNDSNFQPNGDTELVLSYGQVFHLEGWTVEPSSVGTRFTNDGTGRGMFVSRQGVDYSPATPIGQSAAPNTSSQSASPCSSATAEVLKSATLRLWGYSSKPFTVTEVLCSGDWAKTLIDMRHDPNTNPPASCCSTTTATPGAQCNTGVDSIAPTRAFPHRSPPTSNASQGCRRDSRGGRAPTSPWTSAVTQALLRDHRGSIGGDSIPRPDHSKRPDYSGNTTRVDTWTWPFLQQCSKSTSASPTSTTATTPITR